MKRLLGVCVLFLLGALACQPRLLWWTQSSDSYPVVLNKWTRTGKAYQGMKTLLLVTATYLHPATRKAYVRQYTKDHLLSEAQEKDLLAEQEAEAARRLEFIVTVFSDEEDWEILEGKDSIWSVYFSSDQATRVKPEKIEYIESPPIYLKTYYPSSLTFRRVYRIVFPAKVQDVPLLDERTRHFNLEFLSALDRLKLRWNL